MIYEAKLYIYLPIYLSISIHLSHFISTKLTRKKSDIECSREGNGCGVLHLFVTASTHYIRS